MGHRLTLELPDAVYEQLEQTATAAGQTLEEWVLARLQDQLPRVPLSDAEKASALARLMRHAGAVDLGYPTGADNESIDADLARELGAVIRRKIMCLAVLQQACPPAVKSHAAGRKPRCPFF